MDSRLQATQVVRQAEGELRQLLLRAAGQGDYETARMLADWANQLKHLAQQNGSVEGQPLLGDLTDELTPSDADANASKTTNREYASTAKHAAQEIPRGIRSKATRREYPKFFRDGEDLLKIGWSKRTWATYRHKAPKRVVNLVAQALLGEGKSGARFAMEQILPIRDPESAIDVPSYQAYLVLAWLRKENLVKQHGREGYSLRPQTNLMDAMEERWRVLAN